jgi:hypothetical protein
MAMTSPYTRYKWSPYSFANIPANSNAEKFATEEFVPFSGADLHAYVNNIKVGTLESLTYVTNVDMVGAWAMGRRDALAYIRGKRAIAGSITFQQFDKHALLKGVFKEMTDKRTIGAALWGQQGAVGPIQIPTNLLNQDLLFPVNAANVARTIDNTITGITGVNPGVGSPALRGISRDAFARELSQQVQESLELVSSLKFSYSDQIPPFNLTLTGVTETRHVSTCALYGMSIVQEAGGWTANDLQQSIAFSFVALGMDPWQPLF